MYSTELIRKFPDNPTKPILYIVYNQEHITEAETFIGMIHGQEYLKNVDIVTLLTDECKKADYTKYDVYIDPNVYKYLNSWNN